jgi:hypothetical protein
MAKELKPIDVSKAPELLSIATEVRDTGEARVIKSNGEDLAIVMPVPPKARRRSSRATSQEDRDAILGLIGIGESAEPTDIARHKNDYLAEAYER